MFCLMPLTSCKHTAARESRPLLSFRAIAGIYKEVGELFELSVVITENIAEEGEPPRMRLKVIRADGQEWEIHRGAQETKHGEVKFKDMRIDAPCIDNCRLQAELVLPQATLDDTTRRRAKITIPLRIVAASWRLHVTRESARDFKINVVHNNQSVANRTAKISVCILPCLPWSTDANMLLPTQNIKLDETGSWRGKLTASDKPANKSELESERYEKPRSEKPRSEKPREAKAAKRATIYVEIAGRILRQELPAEEHAQ